MPDAQLTVVNKETLPGSQVGLTIEVPQDAVDAAYERVLRRLSQRVKIQGFRPGKAPRALVEAKLGEEAIREEAIETLVPEVVGKAIADQSLETIDRPRVDIQEFARGKPALLKATVSVMPEVKLPGFESLAVERRQTEVTDEMVDKRIEELLDTQAQIEPVEREVRDGDLVVADLDVSVNGKAVEAASRKAMEVEVKEGVLIAELRAALPGTAIGGRVEVDVQMPDDAAEPELRGRLARLAMTVHGVKEKRPPRLDDRIAATVSNGEQQTALELKIAVRKDLNQYAQQLDKLAFEQDVLKALVDASEVEVPASLVDHEIEHQLESLEERVGRQGLKLDRYFAYTGTSAGEWAAQARPDAEARLKLDLVLGQATKQLGIAPADEEVRAYLREEGQKDEEVKGRLDELLSSSVALDYFRHRLTRLRTVERLTELASTSSPEATPR